MTMRYTYIYKYIHWLASLVVINGEVRRVMRSRKNEKNKKIEIQLMSNGCVFLPFSMSLRMRFGH